MKFFYPDGKMINLPTLKTKKNEIYPNEEQHNNFLSITTKNKKNKSIYSNIGVLRQSLTTEKQIVYPGASVLTVYDSSAQGTIGGSFWYFEPSQSGIHLLWIKTPFGLDNSNRLGGSALEFENNISKKYGSNTIVNLYGGRAVRGTILPVLLTNWHNVVDATQLAKLADPTLGKEILIVDPKTKKSNPVVEIYKSFGPTSTNSGILVKDATYDAALLKVKDSIEISPFQTIRPLPIDLPINIFPLPEMTLSEEKSYLKGTSFPYPSTVKGTVISKEYARYTYEYILNPDYLMRYAEHFNPNNKIFRAIATPPFNISFENSLKNTHLTFLGNVESPFRENGENWIDILKKNVQNSNINKNNLSWLISSMGRGIEFMDFSFNEAIKISSDPNAAAKYIVSSGKVAERRMPNLNDKMFSSNTMIVGFSGGGVSKNFAIARGVYIEASPNTSDNQNIEGHSGSLVFKSSKTISLSSGGTSISIGSPVGLVSGKTNDGTWIVSSLQDICRSFDFLLFKEGLHLTPFQLEKYLLDLTIPAEASLLLT